MKEINVIKLKKESLRLKNLSFQSKAFLPNIFSKYYFTKWNLWGNINLAHRLNVQNEEQKDLNYKLQIENKNNIVHIHKLNSNVNQINYIVKEGKGFNKETQIYSGENINYYFNEVNNLSKLNSLLKLYNFSKLNSLSKLYNVQRDKLQYKNENTIANEIKQIQQKNFKVNYAQYIDLNKISNVLIDKNINSLYKMAMVFKDNSPIVLKSEDFTEIINTSYNSRKLGYHINDLSKVDEFSNINILNKLYDVNNLSVIENIEKSNEFSKFYNERKIFNNTKSSFLQNETFNEKNNLLFSYFVNSEYYKTTNFSNLRLINVAKALKMLSFENSKSFTDLYNTRNARELKYLVDLSSNTESLKKYSFNKNDNIFSKDFIFNRYKLANHKNMDLVNHKFNKLTNIACNVEYLNIFNKLRYKKKTIDANRFEDIDESNIQYLYNSKFNETYIKKYLNSLSSTDLFKNLDNSIKNKDSQRYIVKDSDNYLLKNIFNYTTKDVADYIVNNLGNNLYKTYFNKQLYKINQKNEFNVQNNYEIEKAYKNEIINIPQFKINSTLKNNLVNLISNRRYGIKEQHANLNHIFNNWDNVSEASELKVLSNINRKTIFKNLNHKAYINSLSYNTDLNKIYVLKQVNSVSKLVKLLNSSIEGLYNIKNIEEVTQLRNNILNSEFIKQQNDLYERFIENENFKLITSLNNIDSINTSFSKLISTAYNIEVFNSFNKLKYKKENNIINEFQDIENRNFEEITNKKLKKIYIENYINRSLYKELGKPLYKNDIKNNLYFNNRNKDITLYNNYNLEEKNNNLNNIASTNYNFKNLTNTVYDGEYLKAFNNLNYRKEININKDFYGIDNESIKAIDNRRFDEIYTKNHLNGFNNVISSKNNNLNSIIDENYYNFVNYLNHKKQIKNIDDFEVEENKVFNRKSVKNYFGNLYHLSKFKSEDLLSNLNMISNPQKVNIANLSKAMGDVNNFMTYKKMSNDFNTVVQDNNFMIPKDVVKLKKVREQYTNNKSVNMGKTYLTFINLKGINNMKVIDESQQISKFKPSEKITRINYLRINNKELVNKIQQINNEAISESNHVSYENYDSGFSQPSFIYKVNQDKDNKSQEEFINKIKNEQIKLKKLVTEELEKVMIKTSEQVNIKLISEKVYKNIEGKLRVERQRRGMI